MMINNVYRDGDGTPLVELVLKTPSLAGHDLMTQTITEEDRKRIGQVTADAFIDVLLILRKYA